MWTLCVLFLLACVGSSQQSGTPPKVTTKVCSKAFILNAYNVPTYYAETDGKLILKLSKNSKGTRFRQVPALNGDPSGVSLEAISNAGHYIVNVDSIVSVKKNDKSATFKNEASFRLIPAVEGYYRISSIIHPNHYVRHQSLIMKLHKWSNSDLFKNDTLFRFMCTDDHSYKLDICDGEFQLESQNFPAYEVNVNTGKIARIFKTENGTRFKFVNPALNGNTKHVSITSVDNPNYYLSSTADHMIELTKGATTADYKASASFRVVTLNDGFIRFQSASNPRHYIRHSNYQLRLDGWSDTKLYKMDSAWKIECALIPCAHKAWVYDHKYEVAKGPDCVFATAKWWQLDKKCKDLAVNRPSPINIETALCTKKDPALKPLKLGAGWHDERKFTIINNGHSVQANVKDATDLTVEGGNLNGTFVVSQFHFHWGSKTSQAAGNGSEHHLFNKEGKKEATPLEVHIVCLKKGMTAKQAVQTPDAVAVLGGFIRAVTPKEHDGWVSHVLAQMFSDMNKIATPVAHGSQAKAPVVEMEIQLRDLVPQSLHYINYDGAFTTPNCNPVAQWHLFTHVMHAHATQLENFTKLFFDSAKQRPMVDNFRPIQKRHGRKIRCSYVPGASSNAKATLS